MWGCAFPRRPQMKNHLCSTQLVISYIRERVVEVFSDGRSSPVQESSDPSGLRGLALVRQKASPLSKHFLHDNSITISVVSVATIGNAMKRVYREKMNRQCISLSTGSLSSWLSVSTLHRDATRSLATMLGQTVRLMEF